MFLFNLNAEIVACMLSENRATSKIWKIFSNMVFPRFRGKKWRRSEHAHVSYPELFFRHSRAQRLRSFWSAPRIATSDLVQHRKSAIHGLPVTLRMFRASLTNLIGSVLNLLCFQSHSKTECRWTGPEVAILGADQKERGLWGRECSFARLGSAPIA